MKVGSSNSIISVLFVLFSVILGVFSQEFENFDKEIPATWQNINIDKTLDVTKSYTKEILTITAKNIESLPVAEYIQPISKERTNDFALIIGSYGTDGKSMLQINVFNNTANEESEYNYLVVTFPAPIASGSQVDFQLQFVYLDQLKPMPDVLEMNGVQSVLLKTHKYPVSSYPIESYTLAISGTNGKVENLDQGKPQVNDLPELKQETSNSKLVVFESEEQVTIPPFTVDYISLHFEKNQPLLVAENLKRNVWISHWGDSVSFEEIYEVTNKIAKLKDGFSRLQWMQSKYTYTPGPYGLAFNMDLPNGFREAYFTDLVGNVSTSKIVKNHLVLKPRYPLFGGWNYNFTIGWSNDLANFVKRSSDHNEKYIAKVPLLNGHADMSYHNVEFSFYLPENAELLDIASPVPYEDYSVTTEKSYLDFSGHTKVTIYYKNMIDEFKHSDVIVSYKYTSSDFLLKPFITGSFLFIALISYLLITKIDIAIDTRSEKK
ncbi:dolichyl-diphosphooligosaccharide--protein glycotransferase subunit [Saccharomycopsis crataegensis]|uniref:Dolichyl-diphosphooligosaccharide--protein glycosyltransferase subunit 1 n=1 Tax=Saccharomycopsis crataegensis TaxID=43959 RepID=A0AAV5QT36_9ASCO|nr:dolichyl-diphosphooligosaccharide--protein glycotransferase subunit [Saccharomycopsis crataegensis]